MPTFSFVLVNMARYPVLMVSLFHTAVIIIWAVSHQWSPHPTMRDSLMAGPHLRTIAPPVTGSVRT